MRRGQAALETLIIMSVSIVILMVIIFSGQERLVTVGSNVGQSQVKTSLDKLADAADFVYSQGVGASTEVYITIPPSVTNITVSGHSFEFILLLQEGSSSFIEVTTPKLRGSIDKRPGSKYVVLKNMGEFVSVE